MCIDRESQWRRGTLQSAVSVALCVWCGNGQDRDGRQRVCGQLSMWAATKA